MVKLNKGKVSKSMITAKKAGNSNWFNQWLFNQSIELLVIVEVCIKNYEVICCIIARFEPNERTGTIFQTKWFYKILIR